MKKTLKTLFLLTMVFLWANVGKSAIPLAESLKITQTGSSLKEACMLYQPTASNFISASTQGTSLRKSSHTPFFTENFDTVTTAGRWIFLNSSQANKWFVDTVVRTGNSGKAIYISSQANGSVYGYNNMSKSVSHAYYDITFPNAQEFVLSFDWKSYGEIYADYLKVSLINTSQTLTAGDSNVVRASQLISGLSIDSNWSHVQVFLPDTLSGKTKRLVFTWICNSNGLGNNPPAAVDNIEIISSNCVAPKNFKVLSSTPKTINLSWTSATASTFKIEYREKGSANWIQRTTSSTVDTLGLDTPLLPGTEYEIRIENNCGADGSSEWNIINYKTPCWVTTFPLTEGFESTSVVSPTAPSCWSYLVNHANAVLQASTNASYIHSGTMTYMMKSANGGTNDLVLISPYFDSITNLRTRLWYMNGNIRVGYITNPFDISTFREVKNFTTPSSFSEIVLNFDTVQNINNVHYIAFSSKNTASSLGNNTVYFDDLTIEPIPSCPDVFELKALSSTSDSIYIQFRSAGTGFNVWYRNTDIGGAWDSFYSSDTAIGIPYLTSLTNYEIKVQSICGEGSGFGAFSFPITYKTQQSTAQLPFEDNFENTVNFQWTLVNGTQTNKWYVGEPFFNNSINDGMAIFVSKDGDSNLYFPTTTSTTHIYRDIYFPQANEYDLSFNWRAGGETTTDYIRVSLVNPNVLPVAGTEITKDTLISRLNLSSDWDTLKISLPDTLAGKTKRLVFSWRNNNSGSLQPAAAIDNIHLVTSTCVTPRNLQLVNYPTSSSVKVAWTGEGMLSFVEYRSDAPNASWTQVQVDNDTSYTITGLDTNARYEIRILNGCSGEQKYSKSLFVKMPQKPATIPFLENFEADSTRNKWGYAYLSTSNTVQINKWFIGADANANQAGSTYSAYISNDTNTYRYTNTFLGSSTSHFYRDIQFGEGEEFTVSFDWKCNGRSTQDYLDAYLISPNTQLFGSATVPIAPASTIKIANNLSGRNTWQRATYTLPASYANQVWRLVFMWRNSGSIGQQYPAAIDSIVIKARTCATPTNLRALVSTDTTLTICWKSTDNTFKVDYRKTGDASWLTTTASDTLISLGLTSSLLPNTEYEFRVQNICGINDSSFVTNVAKSKTICPARLLPINEDFEATGTTAGSIPVCWSAMIPSTNGTGYGTTNKHSGLKGYFLSNAGTSQSIESMLISPYFTDTIANVRVRFWAKGSTTGKRVRVGYMLSTLDASTFNEIHSIQLTDEWKEYIVSFDTVTTNAHHIVFNAKTTVSNDFYLDDILIEQKLNCSDIFNLQADSSSHTNIYMHYTSQADSFEVGYRKVFGTDTNWHSVMSDTTVTVITGLMPSTTYMIKVRSRCSDIDTGAWTLPISYATRQNAATLPFVENFEDITNFNWTIANGTQINKWVLDTAVFAQGGGNHSVYISNNDGASNTYTLSSSSMAHMYRDIQFPQGDEFSISFDWKAIGENVSDYLRVSLLDPIVIPVAGTNISGSSSLISILNQNNIWTRNEIFLPDTLSGKVKRLVFTWANDMSGGAQPPAAIDNVKIVKVTCSRPRNINVSNQWNDSVTVNWSSSGSDFTLQYKPKTAANWVSIGDIRDTFAVLHYLIYDTTYQVRVRANCVLPTDTSAWSTVLDFSTPCEPAVLPYLEAFNSTAFPPSCWNQAAGVLNSNTNVVFTPSSVNKWRSQSFANITGASKATCLNITGTTRNEWLFSAPVNLGVTGNATLEFDMALVKYNPATADTIRKPSYGGTDDKFIVLYSTDGSWNMTDTLAVWNNIGSERIFDSIAATQTGEHIRIPMPGITGLVRFAFYGESSANDAISNDLFIDNVKFDAPVCEPVTNLQAHVTGTSATVSWNHNETQNQWEIICKEQSTSVMVSYIVNTNPTYTLSGLNRGSVYVVSVRAICMPGDTSATTITSFTINRCDTVNNITLVKLCPTTAVLTWMALNGQTQWQLHYKSTDELNWHNRTVSAIRDTLTGLSANSTYELQIRTICGQGDTGVYTEPITFQTNLCDSVQNIVASRNDSGDSVFVSWLNNECHQNWQISVVAQGNPVNPENAISTNTYLGTSIKLANANQNYDVYVRGNCGSSIYSDWNKITSFKLGIDKRSASTAKVTLAPNPAHESTKLSIEGVTGNIEMAIMTADGKILSIEKFVCQSGFKKEISLKGLAKGTYLIRLTHKDFTKAERLIVQ